MHVRIFRPREYSTVYIYTSQIAGNIFRLLPLRPRPCLINRPILIRNVLTSILTRYYSTPQKATIVLFMNIVKLVARKPLAGVVWAPAMEGKW